MQTIERVNQRPDKTPKQQPLSSKTSMVERAKSVARSVRHSTLQTYRAWTSPWRLLPDFLIIGAQRSGTSSLYFYLTEHPGIVSAYYKEPHYFDDFYTRGVDWYRAQFPMATHKYYIESVRKYRFLTGEASPYYLFHPHVPKRVAQLLPGARLIVLLRNPIDRAYSQHWLEVKGNYEPLPFKEAIMREEERTAAEFEKLLQDEHYHSFAHRRYTYLSRGIYVDQLQHWMQFFPREQFLILRSEDMYTRAADVMRETLEFLGVPSKEINTDREYKQYKVPSAKGYRNKDKAPEMEPELRAYLVDYFRPHNARLKELLGRDFDWDK